MSKRSDMIKEISSYRLRHALKFWKPEELLLMYMQYGLTCLNDYSDNDLEKMLRSWRRDETGENEDV